MEDGFILVRFSPEQLDQVRTLSTTEGFCRAFEMNLRATSSSTAPFMDAYEMTERAHEAIFGRRKYSEYKSFENQKRRLNR